MSFAFEKLNSVQVNDLQTSVGENRNLPTLWFLYVFAPFIALILGIRRYRASWAKNAVWFFVVFYGMTFVISNEGIDANRYHERLVNYHASQINFSVFAQELSSEDSKYVDFLLPVITVTLAIFTDDKRVLFGVFGLIFGFFYSRNIWYLIERCKNHFRWWDVVLIITFALVIPFWQMNGFRMWTAAHIFLYGTLPYLLENKKERLWISGLSVFVHFSFFLPLTILLAYIFLGNRTLVYFVFFIWSVFMAEIELAQFRDIMLKYSPGIFQDKVAAYTHEGYAESRAQASENYAWFIVWYRYGMRITVLTLLILTFFRNKIIWKKDTALSNLLSFSLLFMGITNLLGVVPSMGRYQSVALFFPVAYLAILFNNFEIEKTTKFVLKLMLPFLALFIIVEARLASDTIGVLSIIGNPVLAILFESEIALIDLFKR